jgi:alkylhydroperoxidase/carboxymuconolactone decarboxylase family protein YurZ
MNELPKPPQTYEEFTERFPTLKDAWDLIGQAGDEGPLDENTRRLVKLAVAIGAQREGSVHASVRKGLARGLTRAEMEQVVALAAGTVGLPAAAAAFTWIRDLAGKEGARNPAVPPASRIEDSNSPLGPVPSGAPGRLEAKIPSLHPSWG